MTPRKSLTLGLTLIPAFAYAEPPKIVTDIAPVHSLVSAMLEGVEGATAPTLLVPPSGSAHDFAMRPSDLAALSDADLVILVGPSLTPWLMEPLKQVASGAEVISLTRTGDWLRTYDGDPVAAGSLDEDHSDHDHDEDHADHDDHDHGEDHADHGEGEDHAEGEDHEEHADHEGHAEAGGADPDPHGWLDPKVATGWVALITEELAHHDNANATIYEQRAEAVTADLAALDDEMRTLLDPVAGSQIIWPHLGYGYLIREYGLQSAGVIAEDGHHAPGPAHIRELQEVVASAGVTCILTDGEIEPRWAELISEGQDVTIAEVDILGRGREAGPALYPEVLRAIALNVSECAASDQ